MYCNIDDAYLKPDDLEQMARRINDDRNQKAKDVYDKYKKNAHTLESGIGAWNDLHRTTFDALPDADKTHISGKNINGGFYSAQGKYSNDNLNMTETLIKNIYDTTYTHPENRKKSETEKTRGVRWADNLAEYQTRTPDTRPINEIKKQGLMHASVQSSGGRYKTIDGQGRTSDGRTSDGRTSDGRTSDSGLSLDIDTVVSETHDPDMNTTDTDTLDIDETIRRSSRYTSPSKQKIKRHHCVDFDLRSVDSLESLDSGESLLDHIRTCTDCRIQVVGLIKEHKIKKATKKTEHKTKKTYMELKEIGTICLVGLLIIVCLDLLMNRR